MESNQREGGGKHKFGSLHQRMLENNQLSSNTKMKDHDNVTELIQSIKQSIEVDQSRSKSQFRGSTKGMRLADQFKNQEARLEPSPQYRKSKANHFGSKRTSAMNNSQQQQLPATFRATDALRQSKMNIQTKKGIVYVSQNGAGGFSAAANEAIVTTGAAVFTARRKTEKMHHHNNLKSQRDVVTTNQDSLIPAQIHNRGTIPIQTGRETRKSQQGVAMQKGQQYPVAQISGRGVVAQNSNGPLVDTSNRPHQMQPINIHQSKKTIEKQQQSESHFEITGATSKGLIAKKQQSKFNVAGHKKASLTRRDSIDNSSRERKNILSQSVAGSPQRTKNYFQAVQRVRFPNAHPVQNNNNSPTRLSPQRESLQTHHDEQQSIFIEQNSRQQTKYQSMPGLVVEPVTTTRSIQMSKGTYGEQSSRYGSNMRGLNAEKISSLKLQLRNAEQNSQLSVGGDAIWTKTKGNKLKELSSISEAKQKQNQSEYIQDIFDGKQKLIMSGILEHSGVKQSQSIDRKTVEEKFVETLVSNGFDQTIASLPGNEQASLQNRSISVNKLATKNKRFGLNGAKTLEGGKVKGQRRSNVNGNSVSNTETNSIHVATTTRQKGADAVGGDEVEQSINKVQRSFSRRFQSQGGINKSYQEIKVTTGPNKANASSYHDAADADQTVNSIDSASLQQQQSPAGTQRQKKSGGTGALSINNLHGSRFAIGATAQTSKGPQGKQHAKIKSSESLVINQLVRQMLVAKNRHREGSADNERTKNYTNKGDEYRSNNSKERDINGAVAESDKVINGSILPQIVEVHKKKLQLDTSKVSGQAGATSTKSHRQLSTTNKRNIAAYLEDYSNVKDHMVSGEYNNNPSSSNQQHQMFVSTGQNQEKRQSPLHAENNQHVFRMSQGGTSLQGHNKFSSKDYKETIGSNVSKIDSARISRQQHAHTTLDEVGVCKEAAAQAGKAGKAGKAEDFLDQKRSSYLDLQQPNSIRNARQSSQEPTIGEIQRQTTLDSLLGAPRWKLHADRGVNQVYGSSQEGISMRRAANSNNSLSQQKTKSRHEASQIEHGGNSSFRSKHKKTQDSGKNNQSYTSNQAQPQQVTSQQKYTFAVQNPRKNTSGRPSIQFMSEVPKNLSVIKSQGPSKTTHLKNIISKKQNSQSLTSQKTVEKQLLKQPQQRQSPLRRGSVPPKRQASGRLLAPDKSPKTHRQLKGPQINLVERSFQEQDATRNMVVAREPLAVIEQETSEFYKYSQYSSKQRVKEVNTSNQDLRDAFRTKSPSGKVQHESPVTSKVVQASNKQRKRRGGNQSEKSQRSNGPSTQRNDSARSKSNSASSNHNRRRGTLNAELKNPYSDLIVPNDIKNKEVSTLEEPSSFSKKRKNGLKVICVDQNASSLSIKDTTSKQDQNISLSSRMRDLKQKVQQKNLRRARRASMYQKRANSNLSSGSLGGAPYQVHNSFGGSSNRSSLSRQQLNSNSKESSGVRQCSPGLRGDAARSTRVSRQSRNSQRAASQKKLLPPASNSGHLKISSFVEQRIREAEAQRNVMQTAPTPSQPAQSLSRKSISKTVDEENKSDHMQFSFGQDDELASVVKSINNVEISLDQQKKSVLLPGIDNHYSAKKGLQRYKYKDSNSRLRDDDEEQPTKIISDRNGSPVFNNSKAANVSIALLSEAAAEQSSVRLTETSADFAATLGAGGEASGHSLQKQHSKKEIKSFQLCNSPSLLELQRQQYSGGKQRLQQSGYRGPPLQQEPLINLDELSKSLNLSYLSHANQDLVLLPDFKLAPLPLQGTMQPTKFPIYTRLQRRVEEPLLERFNF